MEGGCDTPFSHGTATTLTTTSSSTAQNGLQNRDREAAIDAEMVRLNKLPAHSSYATHRMKVLNKLRHLLSIKSGGNSSISLLPVERTTSQDEELELLFASLSI
ncbi:hypothetical protein ACP70R_024943 [Stipagrostis hirtigluma subsp. patula]